MNLKFWRLWVFVFGEGFSCEVNMSDYLLIWNVEWCQNVTQTHIESSMSSSHIVCWWIRQLISVFVLLQSFKLCWRSSENDPLINFLGGKTRNSGQNSTKTALPRGWNNYERNIKSNQKCCMFKLDNERSGHSMETVHPGKYTTSNASYLYKDLPKNDTVVVHVSFLNQKEFFVTPQWNRYQATNVWRKGGFW